jgi:hypothetical protein
MERIARNKRRVKGRINGKHSATITPAFLDFAPA